MVIPDPEISAQTPSPPPREHWAHALLHCSLSYPRPLTLTSLPRNLPTRLYFLYENFILRSYFLNRRRIETDLQLFLVKSWESYYFTSLDVSSFFFLRMVIREISYVYVMIKINNIDIDLKFEMEKKGNSRVLGFIYFIDILKRY